MIIGDTHLDVNNGNENVLEWQFDYLYNTIESYAKQGLRTIIQVGDITHNRSHISLTVLDKLEKLFSMINSYGVAFYHILGNHDLYYKNRRDVYSTKPFKDKWKGIIFVENQMTISTDNDKNLLLVPWLLEGEGIEADNSTDMILGHFDIKDFNMTRFHVSTHGLDRKAFRGIPVISGHYHVKQKQGNITYTGTPYQLTWEDFNTEKGIYFLDENLELEFIENQVSPRHVKCYLDVEAKSITTEGAFQDVENCPLKKFSFKNIENCKLRVYVSKELVTVRNFIDNASKVTPYNIKVEIVGEEVQLDEDEMIEEAKNLDITDKIYGKTEERLKDLMKEIVEEATILQES